MRIEGSYRVAASRQDVWNTLLDPNALAECIPGCQGLDLQSDGRYQAKIVAGVAAVKGTFTGYVQLTDQQEPSHYKLLVEGSGGPGFVKGEGTIDLTEDGGATSIAVVGDAQVGGMIAGVGQRVIAPAAKMMMNQFFGCMQKKIESKAAAATGQPASQ